MHYTFLIANTAFAKTAVLACDAKQLQLRSREDKIKDLDAKLKTAASNREFSLLKEQIAADKQANEVLSDEILEGLEYIDELAAVVQAASEELERLEKFRRRRKQAPMVFLLLLTIMVCGQVALFTWRKAHYRSYQQVTLLGMITIGICCCC